MSDFIILYDIFDTKRLPKVKKVSYSYALGGQKSALEAPLDKPSLKELVTKLKTLIEEDDKINIIKILSDPILFGKAKHISYEENGVIII